MANIPATQLKNRISDVLDSVYFKKETAVIERYGKPIAKIVPLDPDESRKEGVTEMKWFLDRTFGSIPDFPDVKKMRHFRDRSHVKL